MFSNVQTRKWRRSTHGSYISPSQKIEDIIYFIHSTLLQYTEGGSALLGRNSHKIPLILSGDFNINFADEKSEPLKQFFLGKFNLTMNNNPSQSTTNYGTTIDAVFTQFIDNIVTYIRILF